MSFASAKDKLKLILDGHTGTASNKLFSQCFDYFEPTPKQFPCAMVGILAGSGESMQDSEYNATRMKFVIRAYFKNSNDSATHDTLLDTLDTLLATLRDQANVTLGGTVEMLDASPEIEVFYTDRESEPVVGFDIILNVLKLNQT